MSFIRISFSYYHVGLWLLAPLNCAGSLAGKIKRICETELGIVSQCCQPRQAQKLNKQYFENVALKINVKVCVLSFRSCNFIWLFILSELSFCSSSLALKFNVKLCVLSFGLWSKHHLCNFICWLFILNELNFIGWGKKQCPKWCYSAENSTCFRSAYNNLWSRCNTPTTWRGLQSFNSSCKICVLSFLFHPFISSLFCEDIHMVNYRLLPQWTGPR